MNFSKNCRHQYRYSLYPYGRECDETTSIQHIELIYVSTTTPLNDVFMEFRSPRTPLILVNDADHQSG